MNTHTRTVQVVGLSVPDVMAAVGLSRSVVYREINSGRLKSFKVGKRRLISPQALNDWVAKLEKTAA
jgi:excisionase family DNA binding protein